MPKAPSVFHPSDTSEDWLWKDSDSGAPVDLAEKVEADVVFRKDF